MTNENRKVTVKSMVNYKVGLNIPELRFMREFSRENEVKYIDFDILLEGLNLLGVKTLFDEGILFVVEEQDRIDLGLQEAPGEEKFQVLNRGQILKLLKLDTLEKFEDTLKKLPKEQIFRVADIAIEEKFTDYEKCKLLKQYCDIDVIEIVKNNEE